MTERNRHKPLSSPSNLHTDSLLQSGVAHKEIESGLEHKKRHRDEEELGTSLNQEASRAFRQHLAKGILPDAAADAWRACSSRQQETTLINQCMFQQGREWKFDAKAPALQDMGRATMNTKPNPNKLGPKQHILNCLSLSDPTCKPSTIIVSGSVSDPTSKPSSLLKVEQVLSVPDLFPQAC